MQPKLIKCLTLLLIATNTQNIQADITGSIARLTGTIIGAGGAITGTALCIVGIVEAIGSTLLRDHFQETKNSISIEDRILNFNNQDFQDYQRELNNNIAFSQSLQKASPYLIIGGLAIAIPSYLTLAYCMKKEKKEPA